MSRDALVVGINSYANLSNLSAPSEDAEAIAQRLEQDGDFQVKRLPETVKDGKLQVGKQTQVTLRELQEALKQLFKPDSKQIPDSALFYFSGHGLRVDLGVQEGFLATSDINPEFNFFGLPLRWLRQILDESPIRQQIVWLDCCHSGSLVNVAEADPGERGQARDRCFIAASRDFETAWQDTNSTYSVLTKELLAGLDPTRHPNRWVTNYSLVDFLNQGLQGATQRPVFTNFGEPINLTRSWRETEAIATAPSESDICPYKGLRYFDCNEEDPKYFHGRRALTDQLLDHVRQSNFVAIVGASGSGKSSVLRAGLLHQLKQGRRLSSSDQWKICIILPGEHPLQALAQAFVDPEASTLDRAEQLGKAEGLLKAGADGLRRLIQVSGASRVVLVVDQFEEVFTLCHDSAERQQFFQCLLRALEITPQLCLIVAMRADFFGKCLEQEYSGLAQRIQQNLVSVTPMSAAELETAILEPARLVDLTVEPELVSQIIQDVANEPASLPLMQYALTELWKQRLDNQLKLSPYIQLGGVSGTLQKRATAVYEQLSPDQQQTAKHIFLALTQLGDETADTRRRVLKQNLVTAQHPTEQIDAVVKRLADENLIVTSELVGKSTDQARLAVVDVAHEALIRHWPLLRQWLEVDRDYLRQKQRIETAAEEWQLRDNPNDYLWQGKLLSKAEAFQQKQAATFSLSTTAERFIQQSLHQRRNNRLKLVVLGLIAPLSLTIYVGFRLAEYFRLRPHWETVNSHTEDNPASGPALVRALEALNQSRQSLEGIYLSTANLSGANLGGADLAESDFSSADLSESDLFDADLRNANLRSANLFEADLSDANLSDANLFDDFRDDDPSGANLAESDLSGADLSEADLRNANLSGADLNGANLSESDLSDTISWTEEQLRAAKLCQTLLPAGTNLDPNRDCKELGTEPETLK
ncbi:pentapeptide repeat-containing protein [Leptolyngbya sp. FACHB-541]|uniref:nSTAND1 domain-containing NTPase n=1 Tax=Leptolyngbya sp. FACHB-541 TaxID=2692810 RepID=UPI001688580C|nr:pentapeptide repeat-containing protein [Leptolyngbya sp. FACHB-541]MBD1998450.1 pentapeptide repeat-containing protein [Leptolyngbya sp. FACHB-541]